jgi:hypothetical protein
VGAIAAYHKYGDRTELTDKSLKGTKEALETLLAYLARSLAEAVRPTIERVLANATTTPEGAIKEVKASTITKELNGEAFVDDISSFVNNDVGQMQSYRNLVHARTRWSTWAKRMSRGVFALLVLQGLFSFYFATEKILNIPIKTTVFLFTFVISAVSVGFCVLCAWGMLRHHEKISEYRDKVL